MPSSDIDESELCYKCGKNNIKREYMCYDCYDYYCNCGYCSSDMCGGECQEYEIDDKCYNCSIELLQEEKENFKDLCSKCFKEFSETENQEFIKNGIIHSDDDKLGPWKHSSSLTEYTIESKLRFLACENKTIEEYYKNITLVDLRYLCIDDNLEKTIAILQNRKLPSYEEFMESVRLNKNQIPPQILLQKSKKLYIPLPKSKMI